MATDDQTQLDAFICHGVDLDQDAKEAVGDCPFCGKENHFYVAAKTGQFHCKVCDDTGNVPSFLRKLWTESQRHTTKTDLDELAEDRGIPATVLKSWGLARSILTDDWLIPAGDSGKGLANLYRCFQDDEGKVQVHSTTGCKLHLFGDANKSNRSTIWVCEGPWDAMALDAVLRSQKTKAGKTLRNAHAIVGLPGATSGYKLLGPLCKGRKVNVLLDHDDAGCKGTAGIIKNLGKSDATVHVLQWDDDLPDGYDVRDLLGDKRPRDAYRFIKDRLNEHELTAPDANDEDEEGELVFIRYADIEPEEVRWLVQDRIPLGKITLL